MAFNEETYRNIQRYLDDQLAPEERQAFEREMQANPALAQEVALNREMQEFLADSPENKLRSNLQLLREQAEAPKKGWAGGKWLWLLLPCFALVGWWLLDRNPAPPRTTPRQEIPDAGQDEAEPAPLNTAPTLPPPPRSPETDKPAKESEKAAEGSPIAASFDPLPALEFLIGNNLRDNDLQWNIANRPKDAALPSPGAAFDFRFAGTVTSEINLVEKTFNLHIFSNDPEAFEAFRPISSFSLQLLSPSGNTYPFDFQKRLTLRPGLYYYLIEDTATEKIYWVDKFVVK